MVRGGGGTTWTQNWNPGRELTKNGVPPELVHQFHSRRHSLESTTNEQTPFYRRDGKRINYVR